MKIVLDTNVFVSGVFFGGPPRRILQAWSCGRVQLVMSPEILYEYSRVGEELGKQFAAVDLKPILELVSLNAEMVSPADSGEPICGDPDDDKFFFYVRFRPRARSLSAETSICWSNLATAVFKC